MLLPPAEPRHEYRFRLEATGSIVREARAVTRTIAEIWRLAHDLTDDAVLVVSELVTNAQRACPGDRLGLLLRVDDPRAPATLRVGVWDGSPARPAAVTAEPLAESGRGLFLVASLAHDHGVTVPKSGGKIVWAEFRLRGPRADRPQPSDRPIRSEHDPGR